MKSSPLLSPMFRLLAALGVTLVVLPYAYGRSLVMGMLTGFPETPFLALTAVSILAVVGLTWNLYPQVRERKWAVWVLPVVFFGWLVECALLVWLRSGILIPKIYVLALFVPATLWLIWLGWMFYRPWSWKLRLGLLVVLLMDLGIFFMVLRVDGLTGDADVNFAWRTKGGMRHIKDKLAQEPVKLHADAPRDFPQFLGPQRSGVLPGVKLSPDWGTNPPREVWRKPVGEGWGGFAIVGDLAFTQEQRKEGECVVCYRVQDGARVWLHCDEGGYLQGMGGPGPRATPTVADGKVYAVGAKGILNCLDAEKGTRLWSVNILQDNQAEEIIHGVCASPLVVDDKVIVCPTGTNGLSLAAYHKETGSRLWHAGKHQASYGSPMVTELAGVRQILLHTSEGVTSHDAATGNVLWSFAWTNDVKVNCSQPIPHAGGPDQVFVSTGYGKGGALIKVSKTGDAWTVEELWSNNQLKTKFTTAVLHEGYLYGLDDGILACLDVKTGQRKWKGGRYGHGQILLAGKLLLVQAEDGKVVLVDPQPDQLRELGRIPALQSKTWNNPALAGKYLLVRNDQEAVCFEVVMGK